MQYLFFIFFDTLHGRRVRRWQEEEEGRGCKLGRERRTQTDIDTETQTEIQMAFRAGPRVPHRSLLFEEAWTKLLNRRPRSTDGK